MPGQPSRTRIKLGKLNPIQARADELFREGKRVVLINTGRQAGKSHYGARRILKFIQELQDDPFKLALVVAPTYRMALVVRRKLDEVLQQDIRLWRIIKRREQPVPTYTFPNGWKIEIHSSDNYNSLRGITASVIWMDEVAYCHETAFDVLMATLLASEGPFLGTTTPRGKENWTYRKLYLPSCPPDHPDHSVLAYDPDYGVVTGSTWENRDNLSEKAIRLLEQQYGGEDSSFGRQEIGGEFVTFEGRVYSGWDGNRDYLTLDQMPKPFECTLMIGVIDFGWHPDPTAAYVIGYKDGTWYAYDGLYETELMTDSLAAELLLLQEAYRPSVWWADSADPENIAELRRRGVNVRPVVKPRINVRIREMAAFANTGRLKVSARCPDVRNEFLTYQWPDNIIDKTTGAEKKPLDKNNHAMDALGYGIWMNRYLWGVAPEMPAPDDNLTEEQREERRQAWYDKNFKQQSGGKTGPAGLYSR